ncbi:uncharacterized protein BDZ83DRAFT_603686 [Colletotrichum acutatum]|uniref:Uncharacterized protein n=1 Tax=Glomerella acutata TaxID=27357 RepID=A0AAD8XLW3_GLOAC|nr:uncharacterized protein BDZ83DRAFT_603686 [Colletotrichum acutatum]KAK1729827.1 hypothetical protein BDZ83DRAFT_603686 [Colletotrichum acutatum]
MFHGPRSTLQWRLGLRWRVHVLIFPLSTLSMQIMCVQCNRSRHRLLGKLRNVAEMCRYQLSITNHLWWRKTDVQVDACRLENSRAPRNVRIST